MPRMLIKWVILIAIGHLTLSATIIALAQGDPQKKPAPPPPPATVTKKAAPAAAHVMLDAAQLKWGPAPAGLPAGAQVAVLDGDPAKPGAFAIRVRFPDGYTVPPHWHPTAENLVILSGTLMMGVGDKIDEPSMHGLAAGAYAKMPAKTNHYARAKGETTFQLYGMGPFSITYVNPKDDPRKKSTP
jgi:quercetin dioxygenase-like cupin family protein